MGEADLLLAEDGFLSTQTIISRWVDAGPRSTVPLSTALTLVKPVFQQGQEPEWWLMPLTVTANLESTSEE